MTRTRRALPCRALTVALALVFLIAAPILLSGGAAMSATTEIVLREYLGQTWDCEFLTYPFTAPRGACHPQGLTLRGPDGPQPVQLSEVELWPDGRSVKSARLSFVSPLAPRDTRRFLLDYSPQPAPAPASQLQVLPGEGEVEISTGRFAVRLLLGQEQYPSPVPSPEVPGPLLGLRLAGGTSAGGSRLYGPTAVTSWSARLLETGPVFARVEYLYTYADGNTARLVAQVNAGDTALHWDTEIREDRPHDGVDFLLSPGLPPLVFPVRMEFFTRREVFLEAGAQVGDLAELPLSTHPPGLITRLTPWQDWWDDYTQTLIPLQAGDLTELQIASRDPGAWVEPAAPGTMRDWGAWQHKLVPLEKAETGEVYLRLNHAQGIRRWTLSEGSPRVGLALNQVKDYVLDWPVAPGSHPRLFFSPQRLQDYFAAAPHDPARLEALVRARPELRTEPSYKDADALEAWLRSGGDSPIAAELQLAERLRHHLNLLGRFDLMRSTGIVACLYDVLIDSDLVTPEDRDLFRAQIAYLAYELNDPSTWSIERGYRSYNENMSVSHLLARGILACLLPDHPLASTWVRPAISRLHTWLQAVGPAGEWFEGGHYDQVTYSTMIWFAVACQRAGFHDFLTDPTFQSFALYLARQQTARDPQRGDRRVPPPLGRAQAGVPWGHFGLLAQATRDLDPEFSRIMQWCWAETGYDMKIMDSRLAGLEVVYLDRSLPAQPPDWTSDWFPRVGAVLRQGLGTEHETYLNLLVNHRIEFARVSEPGSVLKWIARGRPLAGAFAPGYQHRQELLMSRVLRARSWQPGEDWFHPFGNATVTTGSAHSFLPAADYVSASYELGGPYDANWWAAALPPDLPAWPPVPVEGQVPFHWQRQLLLVKDDDPAGPQYVILRDTVTGNQPTLWQFWTLSEKLGTPAEAADREAFLADAPGHRSLPPRELTGDRFTALGQFGMDLEYFIAAPAGTPRHTLRYSTPYGDYGVVGHDSMDSLHLQLPGDGAYFLALYPRRPDEPAPEFATLAGGRLLRVTADWGEDHSFLSPGDTTATAGEIYFRGTCATLQARASGLTLTLGAPGEVRRGDTALRAPLPAELRAGATTATLRLPADHPGAEVVLTLPGAWTLAPEHSAVRAQPFAGGRLRLTLPAGLTLLTLHRR